MKEFYFREVEVAGSNPVTPTRKSMTYDDPAYSRVFRKCDVSAQAPHWVVSGALASHCDHSRVHHENGHMTSTKELHYRYIIVLILVALIECVALGLFNVENLVGKIEFALTITSLVVSVIAIVYAFITVNKQDGQLSNLLATSSNVSIASRKLVGAAESLAAHVNTLPPRFDAIEQKIDELSQAGRTLPEIHKTDPTPEKEPSVNDVRDFVLGINYGGMGVIYLAVRATRYGIALTRELFEKNQGLQSFEFAMGVLTGANGASLLDCAYKNNTIFVTNIVEALDRHLKEWLDAAIESLTESQLKPHTLANILAAVERATPDPSEKPPEQ